MIGDLTMIAPDGTVRAEMFMPRSSIENLRQHPTPADDQPPTAPRPPDAQHLLGGCVVHTLPRPQRRP